MCDGEHVPSPQLFPRISCTAPNSLLSGSLLCLALLAITCTSSSCRKSAPPTSSARSSAGGTSGIGNVADLTTAPGTVFQVTYTDNTVVVDAATSEKTFRGVSADDQLFVFDKDNEQIKKLEAGSVMLLQ